MSTFFAASYKNYITIIYYWLFVFSVQIFAYLLTEINSLTVYGSETGETILVVYIVDSLATNIEFEPDVNC